MTHNQNKLELWETIFLLIFSSATYIYSVYQAGSQVKDECYGTDKDLVSETLAQAQEDPHSGYSDGDLPIALEDRCVVWAVPASDRAEDGACDFTGSEDGSEIGRVIAAQ